MSNTVTIPIDTAVAAINVIKIGRFNLSAEQATALSALVKELVDAVTKSQTEVPPSE